jgi:hypothetical protein
VATAVGRKATCEVAEAKSGECFQKEAEVAGCVESHGEIKRERTEVSQGS